MATREDHPDWTRRHFLAAGCAAVGASTLGGAARAAGQGSQDKNGSYGPFKMGLQSYSLRGLGQGGRPDVQRALEATRDLGVHYWEGFPAHVPMTAHPRQIAERKRQFESCGVGLMGYGVVHLGKDASADRKVFEFAKAMGLKYLSASPEPGSFDALDKLVEEFGVAVGIHNHGPGDRFAKIETIEKAIKDHHPKIGCCVDTGHFLRSREDPVHAVEAFGQRVYGVHLKDVKDARVFTVLGRGDLRTVDLLKLLARNNYDYCLAIEYEENPENPLDEIRDCLAETRRAITEATKA
jgi:sugar phosphate isomerase/epimerase